MFKQLDIDHDKVTINGVEFLKPGGASVMLWEELWSDFADVAESNISTKDKFADERKEYEDQIYDLDCQVEALEDKVSELERELNCADDQISELQDLVEELQTE